MQRELNPLWYKDAIIYEIHVRSFYDSNGTGIGDFKGLMQKLPYLRDLGITAIWILPFYPSPLRDDGYDIADYHSIHPAYGTLRDFQDLLREAHHLGIRVITELVLNHTSDQHPWFQRARQSPPGSIWRDFYVWSDTPEKYEDARIIFKDFETSNWARDPLTKSYYWHRFYSHQPDLNYENPRVHAAMLKVIDFWFKMGVDGLRLDAVPYLYECEGTNCENLPETYQFLKKLRAHVNEKYPDRLLLAEANQWPEDAASYFGDGDACHMAFHFPLMPRMFMALQMEDSFPIANILQQTPLIPDQCQWALFLRNHDELTLEMVTDEERDYMYRVYASDPRARINLGIRRRLAPLMGNDRRKIELMNVLLFTMPGTPIIYYGDEIGMGDNYYLGDRNGVRTPMQWSADRNAGFSPANPQKLHLPVIIDPEYHYEAINVENQTKNTSSLLWWMKRMIDLRKRYKAFGWGSLEIFSLENPKLLAMLRVYQEETILVLINLSRFSQVAEINHPRFAGYTPEEMFGRNKFPTIKDTPYVVMLGPYDFHLLLLTKPRDAATPTEETAFVELAVSGSWESILTGTAQKRLEQILPDYLKKCRWFQGKGRIINRVTLGESMPVKTNGTSVAVTFIDVAYSEGSLETYLLPLHFLASAEAESVQKEYPKAAICRFKTDSEAGYLQDATYHQHFHAALLEMIARKKGERSRSKLFGHPGQMFSQIMGDCQPPFLSQVSKAEQSNSSIIFNRTFFLKLYRRMEEGMHPEVEIGRFLTDRTHFKNIAPLAGILEYRRPNSEPITIAMLQRLIPNEGDAWSFTLGEMALYLDRVLAKREEVKDIPQPSASHFDSDTLLSPNMLEIMGGFYPEMVTLIGKRTAEFHLALASRTDDSAFAPEQFTLLYQRSFYQSMRSRAQKVLALLRRNMNKIPNSVQEQAEQVLNLEPEILQFLQRFISHKFPVLKTRIHGDYHLGQLLYTGDDFYVVDFEGEPARTLSERRIKYSPLKDVAGMVNSFYYAAFVVLLKSAHVRSEDIPFLEPWAEVWYRHNTETFLRSYLENITGGRFVPEIKEDAEIMLNTFLLDKAVYELGYELNNRPEWVMIPLRSVLGLMKAEKIRAKKKPELP
ncbi:MAG TPA: maltose alpha-D-glucosyltransferase [Desulfuromonadaceae bacterium]|jgi:maltose alpha-D-glucosyltransferase/alpha-amylase